MKATDRKLPRHSYFKRVNEDTPEAAFEQALIDVVNATDGGGARVRLIPQVGVPTAAQLRQLTREFADVMLQEGCVFIARDAVTGNLIESSQAETASWVNLALLARATAAAVRHEAAAATSK